MDNELLKASREALKALKIALYGPPSDGNYAKIESAKRKLEQALTTPAKPAQEGDAKAEKRFVTVGRKSTSAELEEIQDDPEWECTDHHRDDYTDNYTFTKKAALSHAPQAAVLEELREALTKISEHTAGNEGWRKIAQSALRKSGG